ncbi:hypothetical protein TRSC58_07254 [Trypanosoma rangeli SC58]|uniref:Uncharacterized protein n=1 Tax=Trypanosoma rangeli SC58 TaxID=429131 RepID=A0A061ITM7_TRYRA|nr:hypothetical protein TRSC58_07254 [Trypanosoma rangeli SC58]
MGPTHPLLSTAVLVATRPDREKEEQAEVKKKKTQRHKRPFAATTTSAHKLQAHATPLFFFYFISFHSISPISLAFLRSLYMRRYPYFPPCVLFHLLIPPPSTPRAPTMATRIFLRRWS